METNSFMYIFLYLDAIFIYVVRGPAVQPGRLVEDSKVSRYLHLELLQNYSNIFFQPSFIDHHQPPQNNFELLNISKCIFYIQWLALNECKDYPSCTIVN